MVEKKFNHLPLTVTDFSSMTYLTICVLSILAYNKYVPISRDIGNKPQYQKDKFGNATENWMNFQPGFSTGETFKTTSGTSFTQMEDRRDPFNLKQTALTAN